MDRLIGSIVRTEPNSASIVFGREYFRARLGWDIAPLIVVASPAWVISIELSIGAYYDLTYLAIGIREQDDGGLFCTSTQKDQQSR